MKSISTAFLNDGDAASNSKQKVVGFVCRQCRRFTEIRTADGSVVRANVRPDLIVGAPVCVQRFNQLRDGSWDGAIVACELPVIAKPDRRALAIIDEANTAGGMGEPKNISDWKLGAVKTFVLGLLLDAAGYRPIFIADPKNRHAFLHHRPSAAAIELIARCPRWSRPPARDWGDISGKDRADRTELSLLRDNPSSILVTSDRFRGADLKAEFPELHSRDFRARIYAPRLEGNIMSIPALGVSMRIPLPVFQPLMPEMV